MTSAWDDEVDLAVLGYGAAGAAAAITASKFNASVLLAEKQSEQRHTPNTKMSRGVIATIKDADRGTEYFAACAGGMIPIEPLRVLADRASKLREWLSQVCPDLSYSLHGGAEHPHLPGADAIEVHMPGGALTGRDLFQALSKAVARTNTRILWQSPARRLIRDEAGGIIGVVLETPAGIRRVRAREGVVLACGGYEYDEMAKLNYLRAYPVYFYGNRENTGDGVRMAQEVGADLWHMNQIVGRGIGNFQLDNGLIMGFQFSIDSTRMGYSSDPVGYVITDRFGKRFANERAQALMMHNFYYDLLHFDSERGIYPRIPCYWFFDDRRRRSGPLSSPLIGAPAMGIYEWSQDNSREIERGWISCGQSISEVAEKAGVEDSQAAVKTIQDYNEYCRIGGGDPLGRPANTLVPLDQPPYYCVKMWPGGSNTTGGPRRDERSQVLDPFGDPIKGLYAAGELGQVCGLLYPCSGFAISETLCFGQIAAESALSRTNSLEKLA